MDVSNCEGIAVYVYAKTETLIQSLSESTNYTLRMSLREEGGKRATSIQGGMACRSSVQPARVLHQRKSSRGKGGAGCPFTWQSTAEANEGSAQENQPGPEGQMGRMAQSSEEGRMNLVPSFRLALPLVLNMSRRAGQVADTPARFTEKLQLRYKRKGRFLNELETPSGVPADGRMSGRLARCIRSCSNTRNNNRSPYGVRRRKSDSFRYAIVVNPANRCRGLRQSACDFVQLESGSDQLLTRSRWRPDLPAQQMR